MNLKMKSWKERIELIDAKLNILSIMVIVIFSAL